MDIDTLFGERSVLKCTQRVCITPCYISRFIVGTLKLESRDDVKNTYMWSEWSKSKVVVASSCISTEQYSMQPSLISNVLCEPAIVSPYPDLTSRFPDARPPHRWIYFPVLRPQQRRRLSSRFTEDGPVSLNQSCQNLPKPDGPGVLFLVRTLPENLSRRSRSIAVVVSSGYSTMASCGWAQLLFPRRDDVRIM